MNIRISTLFVLVVIAASPSTAKPRNPVISACEECIYYNFESDYEDLFTHEGACLDLEDWSVGQYDETNIEVPNSYTETFITPKFELSCTTSFPFNMTGGGNVFVRVYIDSYTPRFLDQVYVLAEQITEGNNPTMGMGVRSNTDIDFQNGWSEMYFPIFGFTSFEGHLVFMGLSNENSTIVVDSFCYKPLGYSGPCWVDETPTTTEVPTPEPTTTEAPTPEPTTTEAPTPEPTTTEAPTEAPTTTKAPTTTETPTTTKAPTTTEAETEPTPSSTASSSLKPSSIPAITVPEPTFSTPPPGYDKCPVNPYFHWLLPHETDCHLFYYCVWGEKVLRECPDNLHFNRIHQVCDWPWRAGCAK